MFDYRLESSFDSFLIRWSKRILFNNRDYVFCPINKFIRSNISSKYPFQWSRRRLSSLQILLNKYIQATFASNRQAPVISALDPPPPPRSVKTIHFHPLLEGRARYLTGVHRDPGNFSFPWTVVTRKRGVLLLLGGGGDGGRKAISRIFEAHACAREYKWRVPTPK